jgi:hypothetical protein
MDLLDAAGHDPVGRGVISAPHSLLAKADPAELQLDPLLK